ncbi:hypothetical protein ALC62_14453 [Cyphomyrmex costatus]|uniref:Uncharacterized protein n=1 Tax=Cyphomyrmex costatus TaxID=456900 RepID=A0A195C3V5_9HYME|nr:hypothetical protein ALC62_14453 [Cyphomyrmex costatus]
MCVQPVAGGRQPTNRGKIMGRSSFVHVGGSMLSAFTFREFRVINRRAGALSLRLDYAISKPSTLKLWDNYVVSLSDDRRGGAAVSYFILEGSICLPYLALRCLACLPTCLRERGGITVLLKYCMASPSPIRIALRHAPPLSYAYAFFSLVRARELVLAALICAVKVKGASGNTGRQAATQTTET